MTQDNKFKEYALVYERIVYSDGYKSWDVNEVITGLMDKFGKENVKLVEVTRYGGRYIKIYVKGNLDNMMAKQREYCRKNGLPFFAPYNAICWSCGRIIPDTDSYHITGCPYCHRSFCE